jgi:hypothetical protein
MHKGRSIVSGHLTGKQVQQLLEPIKPNRVSRTPQGMSHLEAWDVIAHLSRVFGFEGWDKEILDTHVLFETSDVRERTRNNKTEQYGVWTVAYSCAMRLTVRDPSGNVVTVKEDAATGEAINQPSRGDAHDLALKSAISGALKRCAKDLGDQFGLGLYDDGKTTAAVRMSIAYETRPDEETGGGQTTRGWVGDPIRDEAVRLGTQMSPHGGRPAFGTTEAPFEPAPEDYQEPMATLPWVGEPPRDPTEPPPGDEGTAAPQAINDGQRKAIYAICTREKLDPHGALHEILGHPIEHVTQLTYTEARSVLRELDRRYPRKAS